MNTDQTPTAQTPTIKELITIEKIQKMVCKYFDVPYEKLLEKTRKQGVVNARQITMYLAKNFGKQSPKTICEHFGGRDHSLVRYSCKTVKDLMEADSEYCREVTELEKEIRLATA